MYIYIYIDHIQTCIQKKKRKYVKIKTKNGFFFYYFYVINFIFCVIFIHKYNVYYIRIFALHTQYVRALYTITQIYYIPSPVHKKDMCTLCWHCIICNVWLFKARALL